MNRLLFIIILISFSALAFSQRENTLPRKATSAATDTIRVVKDNQSSLMLRSVLQGDIYDSLSVHTDTLQALRADIDAGGSADLSDSITAHRLELNDLHDSIGVHRIDIDANLDSIGVHRTELNNAVDSLAVHRTEINANTSTGSNNASNISANSVFIGVNVNDIASLQDSVDTHTDTLQLHQTQIAAIPGGDVTKVGTPVNNQIGVWTGDGTIEGDSALTFDTSTDEIYVGDASGTTYTKVRGGSTKGFTIYADGPVSTWVEMYNNITSSGHLSLNQRSGGTKASPIVAPTDSQVTKHQYSVYDGTSNITSGIQIFQVDGAIATGDFNTKYTWELKKGAAPNAEFLTLGVNGLEYNADHSTDQAANDLWVPDKKYVDDAVTGADSLWISVTVDTVKFSDTNTEIWEDGSSNLSFKDAVTGTKTLAELAAGGVSSDSSFIALEVDTLKAFNNATIELDNTLGFSSKSNATQNYYIFLDEFSPPTLYAENKAQTEVVQISVTKENLSINHDSIGSSGDVSMNMDGRGLWFNADYSSTYYDRSVVDKAYVDGAINLQYTGALTDGAPTDAQIDSATGTTPAAVGTGWKCTILDSTGSALVYLIVSDGTNWQYTALTIAL